MPFSAWRGEEGPSFTDGKAVAVCPNMHAPALPGDHIDNKFDARLHGIHRWHVLIGFDQTACSSDDYGFVEWLQKTE